MPFPWFPVQRAELWCILEFRALFDYGDDDDDDNGDDGDEINW